MSNWDPDYERMRLMEQANEKFGRQQREMVMKELEDTRKADAELLTKLKTERDARASEFEQMRRDLADARDTRDKKWEEAKQLEKDNADLRAKVDSQGDTLESQRRTIKNQAERLALLNDQAQLVRDLEAGIKDIAHERDALKRQVEDLRQKLHPARNQGQDTSLREQLIHAQNRIEELIRELEETNQEHAEELTDVQKEVKDTNKMLVHAEALLAEEREEHAELRRAVAQQLGQMIANVLAG